MEERIEELSTRGGDLMLQKIGQGFCGTVWATPTPIYSTAAARIVIKREDGGPGRSITNEWNIHCHVNQVFTDQKEFISQQRHIPIHLPAPIQFLNSKSSQWNDVLPRMPSGFTTCNALISEKINPMPPPIREMLVDHFLPSRYFKDIINNPSNDHCLIRPYLGRRRQTATGQTARRRLQVFSLRNFPLHADQMEILGLDLNVYAEAMADALAVLHWSAKVDANDVEFVLAPIRAASSEISDSGTLGEHALWILDFDCCRPISMDANGMEQACRSFWRNDPFYPRPGSNNHVDEEIWDTFRSRYLDTSHVLLVKNGSTEQILKLPEQLIRRITQARGCYTK